MFLTIFSNYIIGCVVGIILRLVCVCVYPDNEGYRLLTTLRER